MRHSRELISNFINFIVQIAIFICTTWLEIDRHSVQSQTFLNSKNYHETAKVKNDYRIVILLQFVYLFQSLPTYVVIINNFNFITVQRQYTMQMHERP